MANTKSAIKALKQNKKRNALNQSRKSRVKTYFKSVIEALNSGKTKEEVLLSFSKASSEAQRAANKKVIHKNNASRKISRLAKKINNKFSNIEVK
jgi:small subunit ribosomal protein S20